MARTSREYSASKNASKLNSRLASGVASLSLALIIRIKKSRGAHGVTRTGLRLRPLSFDEDPPQDLARGRLRDLLDELDLADLLVRSDPLRHERHDHLGGGLVLQHDERLRDLSGLLVELRDHG